MNYPLSYVKMQCKFVAYCFMQSRVDGFDSDDFAKTVMTSEYGVRVLTDNKMIEYSDCTFLYSGFKNNLTFKLGKSYDYEVLELAGYIYKYWISTRDWHPVDIYKIAPISLFASRYGFYHTQDFDYIINDIIDRPYQR